MKIIKYLFIFIIGLIIGHFIYKYNHHNIKYYDLQPGSQQVFIDDNGVCYKYETIQIEC